MRAWLWPVSMAVNKDKLRKRQREYAGIAVLAVTHSNEIVVKVKQSLAASKGWTFLAMECKAWEICSPQCLPVCPIASSRPGGRMEGLLTPFLQGDRNPTICPRNPKHCTALQHRVQAPAAIVALLQSSSNSVLLLPRQLGPQLPPAQRLQKHSSSSAFKHLVMNRKWICEKIPTRYNRAGCLFPLCGRSNTFI